MRGTSINPFDKKITKTLQTKRVIDFVVSLTVLVLSSPFWLAAAFLIKITTPGPAFVGQERMGKGFRPFKLWRFRTAALESRDTDRAFSAPRFSRIDSLLCAFRLAGFPQLFNVLRGEMSLVGPRPETRNHVECFHKDFEIILTVRPGVIDLVSAGLLSNSHSERPETTRPEKVLSEKIELAKLYVHHQGILLDMKVFFSTLMVFLLNLPFPFLSKEKQGKNTFKEVIEKRRRTIIVLIHASAVVASNYIAFSLRFDGHVPDQDLSLFLKTIPIVLLLRLGALHFFGLNQGLWRYVSIQDFLSLGGAIFFSSLGIFCALGLFPGSGYPWSILWIDSLLLLVALSSFRVVKRVYAILTQTEVGARRVLIIGGGNAGEMVARDMERNPSYQRQPVAFLDDDPQKLFVKIHNIPVIGNVHDMAAAIQKTRPDEILIAIPSASSSQIKSIISRCKSFGLPIKILPSLTGMLGGRVSVSDIRNLDIEDLLGRSEIEIDDPTVKAKIRGKTVLVTGAGGSIGSELCRQVAAFQPETLILFERSENNLHHIQLDLARRFPHLPLRVVLGDILDEEKIDQVFSSHRPQIVFHAAAYKHVPMMEENPLEATQNNILGTYGVIMAGNRYGADDFVLISTDKAVNPTSIMGATKRVAEMLVQYFNQKSSTKLVSVRFGNVLESNGSVVPFFREQIKRGGPVTVTHPDIKRNFITIQEAVQLVLHATVLGEGGETFVLDMGEPIRIQDLARTMIILSGFSPEKDIPIEFVGLRPGEKLTEELFEEGEKVIQTRHEKIRLAENRKTIADLGSYISEFMEMTSRTPVQEIKNLLQELIPTYSSDASKKIALRGFMEKAKRSLTTNQHALKEESTPHLLPKPLQ